jgi:hypothetical protein
MMDVRENWLLAVAASTCTCFLLESGSPWLFEPLLTGYGAMDRAQKLDWNVRFVGLVHGEACHVSLPRARTLFLCVCRALATRCG